MGAIPLVTLMARTHWTGFYVRLREQAHGRRPAIGGIPPQPGMSVALIDDLVDREQGARERFATQSLRYRPLITLSEIVKAETEV